jgi:hypothetical protein
VLKDNRAIIVYVLVEMNAAECVSEEYPNQVTRIEPPAYPASWLRHQTSISSNAMRSPSGPSM